MAAPVDSARQGTNVTSAGTSHAINVGSPTAGTLLIVAVRFAAAPGTITFTGYTPLNGSSGDSSDASDDTTIIFYRLADGNEGATDTLTTQNSVKLAAMCWEVTGAEVPSTFAPEISTVAVGTTTANSANPNSRAVTGGPKDVLYLAIAGMDGEGNAPTALTNYSNITFANSGTTGATNTNCVVGGGSRQITNSSSEDPGAFTHAAAVTGWTAYTVAIREHIAAETVDSGTVPLALTPSASDTLDTIFRRGQVYWASLDIPIAAIGNEYVDQDTVPLALTPSGTEFPAKEYVESATVGLVFTVTAVENAELVDTGTVPLVLTPSTVENAQYVEAATATVTLTPSGTEFREITDANTVTLAFTPSTVENAQFVDAATALVTFTPSGTEFQSGTTTDQDTVPLALTPSTVEVFAGVDANTVVFTLTTSSVENAQFADAQTVPLVLTPSGTDVFTQARRGQVYWAELSIPLASPAFEDSATVTLLLTPSAVENAQRVDAATVTLTLTPSGVEGGFVDTGTVTLVLTPSGVDQFGAARQGRVYWAELTIPIAAIETTDTGTVYLDLQPSGVDTYSGTSFDSGTVYLALTPSAVEQKTGTPTPGSVRGLMALYVSALDVGYTDQGTALLKFTPSGTDTLAHEFTDAATPRVSFTPSAVENSQFVQSTTVPLKFTPSATEQYLPPAGTTIGEVYLKLTPATVTELYFLFDVFLEAVLSRRYDSTEPFSKWSGTMTGHWSATALDRRFAGSMALRKWSGTMSRKWSGILGRF